MDGHQGMGGGGYGPNQSSPAQRTKTILAWAKSVASNDGNKIKEAFNIQRMRVNLDKEGGADKVTGKATMCNAAFRAKLKNHNKFGMGSFIVVPSPTTTALNLIAGVGTYSEGLRGTSTYDGCDIGFISDRIGLHSEPAPGAVNSTAWRYYKNDNVSAGGIALSTFYNKDENRLKFFEAQDDKTSYKWVPGFLVLPQELLAWFLENDPTAFELYKKLLSFFEGDTVPAELQFAIDWCICCCNKVPAMRKAFTTILFSTKEEKCAEWFNQRIVTLLGPSRPDTRPQAIPPTPTTPGAATTPTTVTPPSSRKPFMELSPTLEATFVILSSQSRPADVSPVWQQLVGAQEVVECAALLKSAFAEKREDLGITDGKPTDLDFEQIVTDLKNGKLPPGGRSFAFDKFAEGMSLVQCRALTSMEISRRDQKNAAAHASARNLTFKDSLNLQKRDPADPASTWVQVVKCLTAYGVLLATLFTEDCKHFKQVWALRELIADKDDEEDDYFSAHVCRLIAFAVLRDAHNYFNNIYQAADLNKTTIPFPSSSLTTLGNHISELTIPPTPTNFPRRWIAQGGEAGKGGGNGGSFGNGLGGGDKFGKGLGGGNSQQGGAFDAGGQILHDDFKRLLAPLVDKNPRGVPIGAVCHAANTAFHNLPYLNIAENANQMCYRHIFGECTWRTCPRYHASQRELENTPEFRDELCKALEPGVKRLLKDGLPQQQERSRKRKGWQK